MFIRSLRSWRLGGENLFPFSRSGRWLPCSRRFLANTAALLVFPADNSRTRFAIRRRSPCYPPAKTATVVRKIENCYRQIKKRDRFLSYPAATRTISSAGLKSSRFAHRMNFEEIRLSTNTERHACDDDQRIAASHQFRILCGSDNGL